MYLKMKILNLRIPDISYFSVLRRSKRVKKITKAFSETIIKTKVGVESPNTHKNGFFPEKN
jgi:hypothetical protein